MPEGWAPIPAGSPTEAVLKILYAHAYVLGELSPVVDIREEAETFYGLARQAFPDLDLEELLARAYERGRRKTVEATADDEVPN